jgi:hypothetical protein
MKHNFKIGDTLICIKASPSDCYKCVPGDIILIVEILLLHSHTYIRKHNSNEWFNAELFELYAPQRKTNHSFELAQTN